MPCRYLASLSAEIPAFVALDPELGKNMLFAVWKFAKETKIILYPIPQSVYTSLIDAKATFMNKFQEDFERTLMKRQ